MPEQKPFAFKAIDEEGLSTLKAIAGADRFNQWMFETVERELKPGKTFEVGSGIGNLSQFFLQRGRPLLLSDIRDNYLSHLKTRFAGHPQLLGLEQVDLVHPQFEQQYAPHLGRYDNLYALNVVEHIEDDVQALRNSYRLLKPGGRIVILVPAYPWLYNEFDKNLYHYRRYTRQTLRQAFEAAEIPVLKTFHFNLIGILGWYVSGHLMKNETIPEGQMGLYDQLVPVFRLIDRLAMRQMGLSVIAVGEKR